MLSKCIGLDRRVLNIDYNNISNGGIQIGSLKRVFKAGAQKGSSKGIFKAGIQKGYSKRIFKYPQPSKTDILLIYRYVTHFPITTKHHIYTLY